MGIFFLIIGTVLFLAGLGFLVSALLLIVARLRTRRASSVYFQKKYSFPNSVLVLSGVLLIVVAQGFFWFYTEVEEFAVFEDAVSQIQVDFIFEKDHVPRASIAAAGPDNITTSQVVPLMGDTLYISTEIILWKKPFALLGLKDCFRIVGVYYQNELTVGDLDQQAPAYRLRSGPSALVSLIRSLGGIVPAEARRVLSPAIIADSSCSRVVHISPDSIYYPAKFDNAPVADYSN